ncbi:MAG: U32 family peptidase [Lawsonibacter sp.]|nr:U32 family peptidase [Lawsonibacter sp.]
MLELLAPAGSMEAVTAAVECGADAVYFGYGDFNARRGAKNLSREEAAAAVSYCHLRGCRVHLTLNTLLTDRELAGAAKLAAHACQIGVDAIIVQDLGAARMLRQTLPDMPLHGSTQMTVHSLDGVRACADLGMSRVVLGRELSRDQIAFICQNSPIEIEMFGHGALCMCWSGQCFFSGVIGGRSGNRGLCAQPCRLKYGWNGRADSYPLSLKDLSLAGHLREIQEMGVACLKLEGRMKRPEYVAIVTRIYAQALREGREPTREELEELDQAFSRQGFTDGYYMNRRGPEMFGVRQEGREPRELFARVRREYQSGEGRKIPVNLYALVEAGQPVQAAAEDREGRVVRIQGPVPEAAKKVALTREKAEGQLSRTGNTPYVCARVTTKVDEGLSLPLSVLNDLRRQALDGLTRQRTALPARRIEPYRPGVRYENTRKEPVLTVALREAGQLSQGLLDLKPALVYLPAWEGAAHPDTVERCRRVGVPVVALLPRICRDSEVGALEADLLALRDLGVEEALAGNLGIARRAAQLGFQIRGDFGLGVYNSQTLKELKRMKLLSATASFELKLAQVRDLSKALPLELIVYGRLPLMITENCILYNRSGRHVCGGVNQLTDRKGERFPVVKAWGCRSEILNGKKLFLADKAADWSRLGLWGARLQFTTESPRECVQVLARYQGKGDWQPNEYTRGLCYRGVE